MLYYGCKGSDVMFCKECGFEIKENQKFCSKCGASLEKNDLNDKKVKKRSDAFWVGLFSIETLAFISVCLLLAFSLYKMFGGEIETSMRNNLSVLENYGYNIQDNAVYLTNEEEYELENRSIYDMGLVKV